MQKIQPLFFLSSLLFLFLFSSCVEEVQKANQPLTSEFGYNYWHHIQNDGPKPQVGEVAYYYFNWKADDSLMMDGQKAEMVSIMQIPQPIPNRTRAISPLLEGLKLMSIGDSMTLIVPLDSVPGLPKEFESYSNFYYDLVLLDIKSAEENMKLVEEERSMNNAKMKEIDDFNQQILEDYRSGNLDAKIIEKPSGLKYIIHEEGSGEIVKTDETVYVRYHAMLVDGRPFDSSFTQSHLYAIKVGAGTVVAGWDEALTYLKRGTKVTIFVPSDLGYGEEGLLPAIQPNTELAYYIEIVK